MATHEVDPSKSATYISDYTRGLTGVNVPFDNLITQILCASVGAVAVLVLLGRFAQRGHTYLRLVTTVASTARQQRFWSFEGSKVWANIKRHVLYAPLGRKRHNREIQISSAINVGTLPSRFHLVLITLYVASNIAYCSILNYKANHVDALVAELRGRSGNLAVINMVPLFILAGRNNPLIPLLHVSFDTYNLIHRWMGRIVVIESIVHTIAWLVNAVRGGGWEKTWYALRIDPFFTWGLVSTIAMAFLFLHSPSPIRHAFYETFLHLHQLAAMIAVVGLYLHLDIDKLPQLPWLQFVIAMWGFDRVARFARLAYLNVSRRHGLTKVVVKALPGEASRVTFYLPRNVRIPPGSHVYAYLPRISLWMSHPFSVAWVEKGDYAIPEGPISPSSSTTTESSFKKKDFAVLEKNSDRDFEPTCVSLIVGARTGMTRQLYNAASACPNETLETTGFIEGPYSSHPTSFASYGTVILFSGGAGITHHMMHVRQLLESAIEGSVSTRRIYLIWSVRTSEHLVWVREFMDQILRMPNRRDMLVTKLFVSKPRSTHEVSSPSETLQMFPGRCRPDVVLEEVLPTRVGATAVSVCGPGAFADEVRASVRRRLAKGIAIDFVEEAFTW
ncbi:hypothetical protein AJ80_00179 [Polytolypa hystricis UAMH7299]|uniref:FAD-binding FR-type domain-containing protein n=1 Tax=Polytolypa hystricis (strain UAMH7299) TaxID=1447883 RepID=A0A2B7Z581_POLH7|nr:hypothetical protein AJ80_00179 [Polytolypa hystricis UAMH7299]